MRATRLISLLIATAVSMACIVTGPALPAPPTNTSAPPVSTSPVPPATVAPGPPTATAGGPSPPARPDESIMILSPGPGSIVTSPVTVSGVADPAFEQTIVVRIFSIDGAELALEPTTIQADIGMRGPFSVDVPFAVTADINGFIQVYVQSARDGGTTHLETVSVLLSAAGPANIIPVPAYPEQIFIQAPAPGQIISGGTVHVTGFALASFEQTLVIDVYDQNGTLVGSKPVMTNAPDLGMPGPFDDSVTYVVASSGPGRIVVRDPSVAYAGDYHISSVEVTLAP